MVTNKALTVIFVSSEGSAMSLLKKNSAKSRVIQIQEVLDISDKKNFCYLQLRGITDTVAIEVINFLEGRFIDLCTSSQLAA